MKCIIVGALAAALPIWGMTQDWKAALTGCAALPESDIASCVGKESKRLLEEERKALAEKERINEEKQRKQWADDASRKGDFFLRESSTSFATFSGQDLTDKGATFSLQSKNGTDSSVVKAAVFTTFPTLADGIWAPFAGVSWIRDTSGTPKKDIRDITIGTGGPLYPRKALEEKFGLLYALQLTHREDHYSTGDGNLLRAHFDLYVPGVGDGRSLGGLSILPHIAGLWHDRTAPGIQNGMWRSAYAGFAANKPQTLGAQRFKASLIYRKLHDLGVPAGNTERRHKYASLSLDWFFYNTEDKTIALQPSIFITREVGTDFLTGVDKANKTSAGVRFKFN